MYEYVDDMCEEDLYIDVICGDVLDVDVWDWKNFVIGDILHVGVMAEMFCMLMVCSVKICTLTLFAEPLCFARLIC